MFVVDTNIFVYAANKSCPEHKTCFSFLENCLSSSTPWHSTWSVFYEFMRIVTHPRVFPKPFKTIEAWKFLETCLSSPSLSLLVETERHQLVAKEILEGKLLLAGNILHDTRTAILMKEHGLRRIYSRDSDFHRFDFLEVIDPLSL